MREMRRTTRTAARRRVAAAGLVAAALAAVPAAVVLDGGVHTGPVAASELLDDATVITSMPTAPMLSPAAPAAVEPIPSQGTPEPAPPGSSTPSPTAPAPMPAPAPAPAVAPGTPGTPADASDPGDRATALEALFLDAINASRRDVGLPALQPDPELTGIARTWARRMADSGGIAHNPSFASQVRASWQKLGENVGRGGDPTAIARAFVASPAHYRNLVDPDFELVGVGVVQVDTTYYVAQQFEALRVGARRVAPAFEPPGGAESPDILGNIATRPAARTPAAAPPATAVTPSPVTTAVAARPVAKVTTRAVARRTARRTARDVARRVARRTARRTVRPTVVTAPARSA